MTRNEKIALGSVLGAIGLYTIQKQRRQKRQMALVVKRVCDSLDQFMFDIRFDEIVENY